MEARKGKRKEENEWSETDKWIAKILGEKVFFFLGRTEWIYRKRRREGKRDGHRTRTNPRGISLMFTVWRIAGRKVKRGGWEIRRPKRSIIRPLSFPAPSSNRVFTRSPPGQIAEYQLIKRAPGGQLLPGFCQCFTSKVPCITCITSGPCAVEIFASFFFQKDLPDAI